ncbi:MAG TPA: glycerophosphodiester phosphodiesterase [Gemmatimonadaceae bacterium]
MSHILLDPDARPVIAHRGASGRAPENTLASFTLGLREGADALELDVRVSADGVPIVLHDPTLDRTTDATGEVALLPLERIRAADAGARFTLDAGRTFPFRGQGLRVPTLEEVLDAFPAVPILIEIKTASACEAVARVLRERDAAERCLLMSFDDAAVRAFRAAPWLTGATGSETLALIRSTLLRRRCPPPAYRAFSVPERHRGIPLPLRVLAAAARALGSPVHVWTVDSPERARRLWKKGIAGIITNYPREMVEARGA